MVKRYDVLKMLYEKPQLYLKDVEPEKLKDFKAVAKQLGTEGYVRTPVSLSGAYSLTAKGRAYYLDLAEALDEKISDKAEEKRKIISERCFEIFLFVLGLFTERLTNILERIFELISIILGV